MELAVAGNHGNKLWLHTRSTAADGIACSQHEVKNVCLRKTSVFSLFLYLGLLVSSTQGARAQGGLSIWVRVYVLTYEMGKNNNYNHKDSLSMSGYSLTRSLSLCLCTNLPPKHHLYLESWQLILLRQLYGPTWLHVSLNKNVLVFIEQGDCMSDKEWCLHNQRHYVIRIFPLKYYLLNWQHNDGYTQHSIVTQLYCIAHVQKYYEHSISDSLFRNTSLQQFVRAI